MNEDPGRDAWTLGDFELVFEGQTVTLMGGRSLRRELAQLRAALRPSVAASRRVRFPQAWETIHSATLDLQGALPPTPPESGGGGVRARELLPDRQRALLAHLARYAWGTLRAHPRRRLWLVPAVYSLRMQMLLDQQLCAAFVRYARIPPWIGKPRPQATD